MIPGTKTFLQVLLEELGEEWKYDERSRMLVCEEKEFDALISPSDRPEGFLLRICSPIGGYHVIDSCFFTKITPDTVLNIRRMIYRWRRQLKR